MNIDSVIAFAIATLGETLSPGPTVLTLLAAIAMGLRRAWGVVFGVMFANLLWLVIIIPFGSLVIKTPTAIVYVAILGGAGLVFVATTGAIRNLMRIFFSSSDSAQHDNSEQHGTALMAGLVDGFKAHFLNLLSAVYYFGLYTTAAVGEPSQIWILGSIAVGSDLLIYSIVVVCAARLKLQSSPAWAYRLSLLANFAMLWLVLRVYWIYVPSNKVWLTAFVLLVVFLFSAMYQVGEIVDSRVGRRNGNVTWRTIGLWQSICAAFAAIGSIFAVLAAIDQGAHIFDLKIESAIKFCALASTVAVVTLAYAKSRGELADAKKQAKAQILIEDSYEEAWSENPLRALGFVAICLSVLFVFVTLASYYFFPT